MFSNTQLKTAGSAFALVLVVIGLLAGATGGVVAQTSTATPTDTTTGVTLANSTIAVDNDTRSVYADVAAGENSSVDLEVTFRSVDENGNLTSDVNETRSISLNASEEQLVERTDVNTSAYDGIRVKVTAPNVDETNATAEVGEIAKVAGGGGAIGSAVERAGGIGVVVLIGGIALLYLSKGDD